MAYRLLHHGLVVVDVWRPRPGIYWLRLFANEEPRWLAIVTEVPGNPSAVGVTVYFKHATWADVKRLLGEELPKIPAHPELYEQVIASGGGIVREIVRDVFEAFHVDALPPPHNPFNCAHIARFRAFEEPLVEHGISHDPLVAGQQFLESLTAEDLAQCRYHRADWKVTADESVR